MLTELRKAADDLDIINDAGRQAYLAKAGDKLTEGEACGMMDAGPGSRRPSASIRPGGPAGRPGR